MDMLSSAFGYARRAKSSNVPSNDRSPFSSQYLEIGRDTHQRPVSEIGRPALIGHIAIWPDHAADPTDVAFSSYTDSVAEFLQRRLDFFGAINSVLLNLQERGRWCDERVAFELDYPPADPVSGRKDMLFKVTRRDSLAFTLWWPDGGPPVRKGVRPPEGALRVRVHVESYIDHVTISLFIDPGRPWNHEPIVRHSAQATGIRQRRIFTAAETVQSISAERLRSGSIDGDLVPERGISKEQADALLEARTALYDRIWQEFHEEFGFNLAALTEKDGHKVGEIFALFHGAVLSTSGQNAPTSVPLPDEAVGSETSGTRPFHRFDAAGPEPNAVVKAFWPFVRRMTPFADHREFIACGVLNWRALFITSLGAASTYALGDESDGRLKDVPAGGLIELNPDYDRYAPSPVRYLLLTKGEPHRRQLGRIIERINALGTMRLFVFKNWRVIQQASDHLRLRGPHLDHVMTRWHRERQDLESAFGRRERELKALAPDPKLSGTAGQIYRKLGLGRVTKLDKLMDKKSEELADLARRIENDLVEIGTALGEVGELCPGGIHYTINRANYYIKEFTVLRGRLEAGNIETWVSYDQFVDRGLRPNFDFITATGERLAALRNRLQTVMNSIQTSAVFVQSAETRRNTQVLKDIAEHWRTTNFLLGLWGIVVVLYNSAIDLLPDGGFKWLLFGVTIVLTLAIFLTNRSIRRQIRRLKRDVTLPEIAGAGVDVATER